VKAKERTLQREIAVGLDRRLRTTRILLRGRMVAWAAQLEWWDPEEGRWVWVARYDTKGGRPHRDRNRIAPHEEVSLPEDPGRALNWAEKDLLDHMEGYIEGYRAAKAQGKEAWS